MNKADLIAKISGDNGLTKATAEKALNSVIEGVSNARAWVQKLRNPRK